MPADVTFESAREWHIKVYNRDELTFNGPATKEDFKINSRLRKKLRASMKSGGNSVIIVWEKKAPSDSNGLTISNEKELDRFLNISPAPGESEEPEFGNLRYVEERDAYEQKLRDAGKPSRYFDWLDFAVSETGDELNLWNQLSDEAISKIPIFARKVLDPINDAVGGRIVINSGFRTLAVNKAVGGVSNSQHMKGEAADIAVPGMSAIELAQLIFDLGVPFDQLIWYDKAVGGHVHVSYKESGNRSETLHKRADGSDVSWRPEKKK